MITLTLEDDLAALVSGLQRVLHFHGKEAPQAPTTMTCELHVVGEHVRTWKILSTLHGNAKRIEPVGNNTR